MPLNLGVGLHGDGASGPRGPLTVKVLKGDAGGARSPGSSAEWGWGGPGASGRPETDLWLWGGALGLEVLPWAPTPAVVQELRSEWGALPCPPLTRPHSAHSPHFPGGQPAARGAQHPKPGPAGAVQAEGTPVQQRPEPSHAHTCSAHLTPDAHHTPGCHPSGPGTSGGPGGPSNPAPRPATAQEEPVPHGRCAPEGLRAPR